MCSGLSFVSDFLSLHPSAPPFSLLWLSVILSDAERHVRQVYYAKGFPIPSRIEIRTLVDLGNEIVANWQEKYSVQHPICSDWAHWSGLLSAEMVNSSLVNLGINDEMHNLISSTPVKNRMVHFILGVGGYPGGWRLIISLKQEKMKFGEELESQMVPEWQEAYLDYKLLKNLLKELKNFKQRNKPSTSRSISLRRTLTHYREFSGLTGFSRLPPTTQAQKDLENQVIFANDMRLDGTEGSGTLFMHTTDDGGELLFSKKLQDEFNKILKFYMGKVDEVMEEAGHLNKQMEALIAFRVRVEHPEQLESEVQASTAAALSANISERHVSQPHLQHMDVVDEESSVTMRHLQQEESLGHNSVSSGEGEEKPVKETNAENGTSSSMVNTKRRPPSVEILEQVKFNATVSTPRSTIKECLKIPQSAELKFSKDNLRKAEKQLKKALLEFYNKLNHLKSYSFLNLTALSKIMRKYDKITSRSESKLYMKMVDNSYLGTSDEVNRLLERTEATFIKHFANSSQRQGLKILKPGPKRVRHRVSFTTGFLVGCTVSLIVALILTIHERHILDKSNTGVYMETMFPLYSFFGFIIFHMLTYAACIYFWRKYRVNYSFIIGFKPGTELGYQEMLLISFGLSVLALLCVLANLDMEMDPHTQDYEAITELLPLVLLLTLFGVMICPFNIFHRSSRYFLLNSIFHCFLSPLYKVTLRDFLVADQFTSQVQALRSVSFYICYYGWGDFRRREDDCSSSHVFLTFSYILGGLPFWWRCMQCLRRWYDEGDVWQGFNGIKYFMTIVAVCARTAYNINGELCWLIVAWITSIIATVLLIYWDIYFDMGLLQRNSRNRFLRDKLLIPCKTVYFVAMVLDAVLRLAWIQTVMNIIICDLHKQTMVTIMASLEILRRGSWNFFRLENEHINNVGHFRAFKSVPFPFYYDDQDKDD